LLGQVRSDIVRLGLVISGNFLYGQVISGYIRLIHVRPV